MASPTSSGRKASRGFEIASLVALFHSTFVLCGTSCSAQLGAPSLGDEQDGGSVAPDGEARTPDPVAPPDTFADGEVDVVTVVRTAEERKAISPLIYGINTITAAPHSDDIMASVTFVRRGGDRANAYNWETNVSNGSHQNNFSNDLYLAAGLETPNEPAAVDLEWISRNRAAGRGSMVPFVLNDYVSGPVGGNIPYDDPGGWDRSAYFERLELVKPTPLSATPDRSDGVVYTDEHFAFMRSKFADDIYAPGPTQVMVGIDNEPDLYAFNFPMLQEGSGDALYADNGTKIGERVTGYDFTARFLRFAKRIKSLAPSSAIVGPGHYHFDGWTTWHNSMSEYSGPGRWYMDDFLASVKDASEEEDTRLLDTWDFHWYPQTLSDGVYVWDLDDSVRPLTSDEIEWIIQGPRSYWDHDFDEDSWITRDHLFGPAYIIERLQARLELGYPGTKLGVSEYFPGGCAHVSSGLAVADTLGIFARMGVHLAAMWPACDRLEYAVGAIRLLRHAGPNKERFAETAVRVEHPEKVESSVYAGSDAPERVTMLVVNKTNSPRRFGLRAFHDVTLTAVDVYRIDAEHPEPHLAHNDALTKHNAYAYTAPPMSAAMLVFTTAAAAPPMTP